MNLGKNFIIHLSSIIISGVLPLILMPFLTHRLAPVDYGIMTTINTVVALTVPLLNWSTTSYIGVQYFKIRSEQFSSLLSSVLLIPIIHTVILLLVFTLARNLLSGWLGIPSGWNILIPPMALFMLIPLIVQVVLRMQDRVIFYAVIEISGALISFLGTIALVLCLGWGWEGRIIAGILASVILSLASIFWLFRKKLLILRFMSHEFKASLRFGAGGVAHELASQALRMSDRLLIVTLIGQVAVGTYAVAVQWSSIMLAALSALNRAWVPFLFSALSNVTPGSAERLVRQTYLVWAALLLLFIAFSIATPAGYHLLVDKRYHGSMAAAFWLTLGYFFNGIYVTIVDYIFYLKKTHILAMITVFNLLLNTGLAYFLIGIYGAQGAAIAFAITSAIVMCLTFVVSYKLHPMPWLRGIFR
jgi:O-antigen/teichoic acid export membrane protein